MPLPLPPHTNTSPQGFEAPLMRTHLRLISATTSPTSPLSTVTFELTVPASLCSRTDNLHGAAVGLIMDMVTTLAVAPIAREDFWHFGGVSRTLGVTFLRPCPLGEVIVCVGEVVQVGRLLGKLFLLLGGRDGLTEIATIKGTMTSKSTGKILALAEHNKAFVEVVDSRL